MVICEPLCYIFKKFLQFPAKLLKQTLIDFYDYDALCKAKSVSLDAMNVLIINSWVKLPKRRRDSKENPGNNAKSDVDDIILILSFFDDNKLISRLPTFVAAYPDLMPSIKLSEGDLHCVMLKVASLSNQLNDLNNHVINSPQICPKTISEAMEAVLNKYNVSDVVEKVESNLEEIKCHVKDVVAVATYNREHSQETFVTSHAFQMGNSSVITAHQPGYPMSCTGATQELDYTAVTYSKKLNRHRAQWRAVTFLEDLVISRNQT